MGLPYLWKETAEVGAERSVVPVAAVEGRSQRKKCVQMLTESAMRRRLRMGLDGAPKKSAGNVVKRRALGNATNGAMESVGKEVRMHGMMNENVSRRGGSLRRKRGQFDLYAQGVSSEFSLLAKTAE